MAREAQVAEEMVAEPFRVKDRKPAAPEHQGAHAPHGAGERAEPGPAARCPAAPPLQRAPGAWHHRAELAALHSVRTRSAVRRQVDRSTFRRAVGMPHQGRSQQARAVAHGANSLKAGFSRLGGRD